VEVFRGRTSIEGVVKATVTGRPAPATRPLGSSSLVQVFLHTPAGAPDIVFPGFPRAGGGITGGLALFVRQDPVACALLETRYSFEKPPPMSVGQVYCRWPRKGDVELGCELRDFLAYYPGQKPSRLASRWVDQKG